MNSVEGNLVETDVLVIGGGAGGLMAALSAKRHGLPGTRVTLIDAAMVGRCGHTAFSNAWTVAVLPDDDLDGILGEIVAGNDGIADQILVRDTLADSHARLRDLESMGMRFERDAQGQYIRRPTRGLDLARVLYPDGGGLEFSWLLRRAVEELGVQVRDRTFITGLLRDGNQVTGAVGMHGRTGEFLVFKSRATIVATNAIGFRAGFVRDIAGTGTLLAYEVGAALRNSEFSYVRPGTPRFYFEGITFAIQEGAKFTNADGEAFMARYEPEWGDEADVPRIARAMAIEKRNGHAPLYLDMSGIPEDKQEYFLRSKVRWMDNFFHKLGSEAKTDMFGKTPYYPMNQMTKMGIGTSSDCRSDVPGLLAAGLAQAGCANHFAGFHIGLCIGNGWIAGRSAIEDLDRYPARPLNTALLQTLYNETLQPWNAGAETESDEILHELQQIMFAYDIGILKQADRIERAWRQVKSLTERSRALNAPHVHELVRLKETDAMLLAARLILGGSLYRTESRLSHFREDYPERNDRNWAVWVDATKDANEPRFEKTPIPTPLCPIAIGSVHRPQRLGAAAVAGH